MKFGNLLEFHRIPEWYTQYCMYNDHKKRIDTFKQFCKIGHCKKLKGYYTINSKGQIYCIDFIKNYKEDVKKKEKESATTTTAKQPRKRRLSTFKEHATAEDYQPNRLFHSDVGDKRIRAKTESENESEEDTELGISSNLKSGSPEFGLQDSDSSLTPVKETDDNIVDVKVKGQEMKKKGKGKQLAGFEGNKIEEEEEKKSALAVKPNKG